MIGLVILSVATLAFVLGLAIGHRSPSVCHIGTCCARATRCEGHR